jgi:hypothetical protein
VSWGLLSLRNEYQKQEKKCFWRVKEIRVHAIRIERDFPTVQLTQV